MTILITCGSLLPLFIYSLGFINPDHLEYFQLCEADRHLPIEISPAQGWLGRLSFVLKVVIFVAFERRADGHPDPSSGPQKIYNWSCFSEGNFLRTYTKLVTQPSIMNEILTRNLTICKKSYWMTTSYSLPRPAPLHFQFFLRSPLDLSLPNLPLQLN